MYTALLIILVVGLWTVAVSRYIDRYNTPRITFHDTFSYILTIIVVFGYPIAFITLIIFK